MVLNKDDVATLYANQIRGMSNGQTAETFFKKQYTPSINDEEFLDKAGIVGVMTFYDTYHTFPGNYDYDPSFGAHVMWNIDGKQRVAQISPDDISRIPPGDGLGVSERSKSYIVRGSRQPNKQTALLRLLTAASGPLLPRTLGAACPQLAKTDAGALLIEPIWWPNLSNLRSQLGTTGKRLSSSGSESARHHLHHGTGGRPLFVLPRSHSLQCWCCANQAARTRPQFNQPRKQ